jgi:hypothetical protein
MNDVTVRFPIAKVFSTLPEARLMCDIKGSFKQKEIAASFSGNFGKRI